MRIGLAAISPCMNARIDPFSMMRSAILLSCSPAATAPESAAIEKMYGMLRA
jgi:hypothetical protein